MTRRFVRASLIGLIALVAIGSWLIGAHQSSPKDSGQGASTWIQGECHKGDREGTTLVVDFGEASGKSSLVRCVQNYSGNSWALFAAAGMKVTGTAQYPVGFVCRINGVPTAAAQSCASTPDASTGSWAFFIGSNVWQYALAGASSYQTTCGAVEGWRYVAPGQQVETTAPRVAPHAFICAG
jgi:hypothetical protein